MGLQPGLQGERMIFSSKEEWSQKLKLIQEWSTLQVSVSPSFPMRPWTYVEETAKVSDPVFYVIQLLSQLGLKPDFQQSVLQLQKSLFKYSFHIIR